MAEALKLEAVQNAAHMRRLELVPVLSCRANTKVYKPCRAESVYAEPGALNKQPTSKAHDAINGTLLQAVLSKHVKQRLLSAWHDVYIHAIMKRFQMARAQGLHRQHVELQVMRLWQAHCMRQQHKGAMQAQAHRFARQAINTQCILCSCMLSINAELAAHISRPIHKHGQLFDCMAACLVDLSIHWMGWFDVGGQVVSHWLVSDSASAGSPRPAATLQALESCMDDFTAFALQDCLGNTKGQRKRSLGGVLSGRVGS